MTFVCPVQIFLAAQLHDLQQLKQENSYLTTIAKQIAPYVRSIAKVKERLEPRLKEPKEWKEDQSQKIYDDISMASEIHNRNDSTVCSEDNHENSLELKADNRTLSLLNEDPSLKSKDYYRLKQKSAADVPSWKGLTT
ncbi:hypothetical protein FKM82_023630 [Ascaphus truei]